MAQSQTVSHLSVLVDITNEARVTENKSLPWHDVHLSVESIESCLYFHGRSGRQNTLALRLTGKFDKYFYVTLFRSKRRGLIFKPRLLQILPIGGKPVCPAIHLMVP
jgi:hypothetical protein